MRPLVLASPRSPRPIRARQRRATTKLACVTYLPTTQAHDTHACTSPSLAPTVLCGLEFHGISVVYLEFGIRALLFRPGRRHFSDVESCCPLRTRVYGISRYCPVIPPGKAPLSQPWATAPPCPTPLPPDPAPHASALPTQSPPSPTPLLAYSSHRAPPSAVGSSPLVWTPPLRCAASPAF